MHKLIAALRRHPLFCTLIDLRGNARACIYSEPLWGIPYNLYIPFATLYMYELGLHDKQIGLLLTIGMVMQIITCFMAGVLTDKLGRRLTTVVFDIASWSIPCLIWAFSQNFWWFLVATIFNSMWQVTMISWNLLLVEDCDPKDLVHIYTWCAVCGLVAVFFAPLSGFFVAKFSLVPTVRVLYFISFVLMTLKFVIVYIYTKETPVGVERKAQSANISLFKMIIEYKEVFTKLIKNRTVVMVLLILVLHNITNMVSGTFFSLYVAKNLMVPEEIIPIFSIVRSLIMLPFIFFIQHKINALAFRIPMIASVGIYIAAQIVLICSPVQGYITIVLYVLLEAVGFAVLMPRRESLLVLVIEKKERARSTSIVYVAMVGLTSPFGVISGWLSDMNRMLPFILNIVLFAISVVFIMIAVPKYNEQIDG